MRLEKYLFIILIFFCFISTKAQEEYSNNTFIFPIDFTPVLSGTFGELRSNHFHSGIDIKTQGAIGKSIYALEDGYVSRIKVSPSGFGNTLYVNHEDGYTSVFAHLQGFRRDMADYVREEQYRRESFAVDLYLDKDQFMVRKGEIIALSGNSGYSFGPHLHFEIREASTQKPINPLLFGFKVKDDIPPKIKKLKIYPESDDAIINQQNTELDLDVTGYGTRHYIEDSDTVLVYGDLSFGLLTYDLLNGAANKNGIYEMKIWFDTTLFFHLRLEKFAFSETRYINSLIDYAEYQNSKQRYIRSKLDPNNRLNIYEHIMNDGVITLTDSNTHIIKFEIVDVYNNRSALSVVLKGTGVANNKVDKGKAVNVREISWRDESTFEAEGIKLFFPAYSFYDNVSFEYSTAASVTGTYSQVHHLGNDKIPVHKYLTLSIQPAGLPAELLDKALLAYVNGEKGQNLTGAGGAYKDGMVTGKIRNFGKYTIAIDTVSPNLKPLNVNNKQLITRGQRLKFKIKDEFSGIKSYRGTMNGDWILMQYDAKNDLLYYIVDDRSIKGDNHFKLEIIDQKDNITIFEAELKLK